ncbi:MAG: metallophosphoesterase [Corallococcus sp.]|nr:metallophosphoesterase [Corallococcus sp.]
MRRKVYLKPLIIVCAVYLAIVVTLCTLIGIFVSDWKKHSYAPASYGSYEWNENTEFRQDMFPSLVIDENASELKIMQIADPQIKFGNITRDVKTMDLLARALDAEKPDIAVCTGDLTLSIFTYKAYKYFADFMEARKQYWTVVYGNHDDQFDCSKYTLYTLLKDYEYCLFDVGPSNVKGECNFLINVYKGEAAKQRGDIAYSLIMLDSNTYPTADAGLADWVYDWFGEDQVSWYEWAVNGITEDNPDVQSTAFFHIPVKETAEMYYAHKLQSGETIPSAIDTSEFLPISDVKGTVCEKDKSAVELMDDGYEAGIFYQGKNTGFFDKAVELGNTKAMFYGHDHVNTLRGYYGGIYMGYGLCCGYHTYPFFPKDNLLLKMFGLSDLPLFNMEKWVDENGKQMEKGVTNIRLSLADSDYGALTVTNKFHSEYIK